MILIKTWERYFLWQMIKVFFLFICSFCFLYVLIDYSANIHVFRIGHFSLIPIVKYYLFHLIIEANILVPAALLLSTIKVLSSANNKRELIALMAGGICAKKIIRPLLAFAVLCTGFLYINAEYFIPSSHNMMQKISGRDQQIKPDSYSSGSVKVLHLQDHSKIIYQNYDPEKQAFFDVFWVRSPDDIYHMKYLFSDGAFPTGKYVDHMERNSSGALTKTESFTEKAFNQLSLAKQEINDQKKPLNNLSLSELWSKATEFDPKSRSPFIPDEKNSPGINKKYPLGRSLAKARTDLFSTLLYKASMPLLCLLAVLIPAPYCMRYNRNLPVFFLYAAGIFGFIAFYTLMQAAYIFALGHHGSSLWASPIWLLAGPLISTLCLAGWRFARL